MSGAALEGPAGKGADADQEWNTRIELQIAPHPGLALHQQAAIAADYGMINGRLTLRPRLAMAYYVKRRLGLVEGHEIRSAKDQHIVLLSERVF